MSELEPEVVEAEVVPVIPGAASLGIDLPEDPDEALSLLMSLLEESREEATSYLDDLKRVAADFDNFRKRALREQSAIVDHAAERVIRALLPVLDSFDAALATEVATDAERRLLSGMIGTREQLLSALETEGLKVIPTIGEPFDPEVHEPAGAPQGSGPFVVAQELRRGYRLRGKLLRASLVALESKR
jgi:molecular chaperone GrpE